MSRFPVVNNLENEIISAITNTNKETFSGTKVFAALQCFVGLNNVPNGIIGNDSYYEFNFMDEINNHKRRIPPLLKSIEVKTAGTLGAIKKAEVVVQFSSMDELKNNRGFLQIGKTQLLVWGWSKDRKGKPQSITPSVGLAVEAINASKHIKKVLGKDWDMHAGILTNFSFKINENLTVDATLELSQPSDIPAFLALANKHKKAHVEKTSEETSKPFAEAAQAAALDPDGSEEAYQALLNYTINISDEVFDWTYGNTDTPYIAFSYICKVLSNKSSVLKMGDQRMDIDIDNAIASGVKRMISVSEHVIIPAQFMPKVESKEETSPAGKAFTKLVFIDANENFAPIKLGNNTFEFPSSKSIKKWGVTLNAYEWGYLGNVFISADFLKEAAKGVDNNREFLEKVINELNVAGAGLWNLGLRDIEDDKGFMVYTIVDYNLTHNISPPPLVDLTAKDSTITNIDLQADLPKEVAGQAMLGEDNTGHDTSPGTKMFNENVGTDPVLGAATKENETFESKIAQSNSGKKEEAKDNKSLATETIELVEDVAGLVASMVSGVMDAFKKTFNAMMDAPAEAQVKLSKKPYYADGGSDSHMVVFKEAGQVKNLYFNGKTPFKNVLLPVKISFTTLGVGGFVVGKALNVDMVPWLDSSKGFWQITDVKHSIDDTKWTTDIEIRFRVKY